MNESLLDKFTRAARAAAKATLAPTLSLLLLAISFVCHATPVDEAKQVFTNYVSLASSFNIALADLYSDNAVILHTRRLPDGTSKSVQIEAAKYKGMIRTTLPAARSKGEKSADYAVVYREDKDGSVWVSGTRRCGTRKDADPFLIVVAAKNGRWQIVKEYSESRLVPIKNVIENVTILQSLPLGR